jgi:hypothetical protein
MRRTDKPFTLILAMENSFVGGANQTEFIVR